MDSEQSSSNHVCHLNRLPSELRNYLFSFLDLVSETDEEFLHRTARENPVPSLSTGEGLNQFQKRPKSMKNTKEFFSACKNKKSCLREIERIKEGSYYIEYNLEIVDILKKKTFCQSNVNAKNEIIAIQSRAPVFAYIKDNIYLPRFGRPATPEEFNNQLILKNIINKKEEAYDIGHYNRIDLIGFNKQDTKVVIRGVSFKGIDSLEIIKVASDEVHAKRTIGTLEDYLKQKGACKSLSRR